MKMPWPAWKVGLLVNVEGEFWRGFTDGLTVSFRMQHIHPMEVVITLLVTGQAGEHTRSSRLTNRPTRSRRAFLLAGNNAGRRGLCKAKHTTVSQSRRGTLFCKQRSCQWDTEVSISAFFVLLELYVGCTLYFLNPTIEA